MIKKKGFHRICILCTFGGLINLSCFWDYDTLAMENEDFPGITELISGKFLRHSTAFYTWRIKDRELKINTYPDSLSLYDDLAVAYSKIDSNTKAIEIIMKKETIKPGLYETYANMGTFCFHDGQTKRGIKYIKKALKINPEAHFGREAYQLRLAEYVLTKKINGKMILPLDDTERYGGDVLKVVGFIQNFYTFLLEKYNSENKKDEKSLPGEELKKAIKGVMGMMKFGNYDAPVLLEALGDLLLSEGKEATPRNLAARAFLRASQVVKSKTASKVYLKKVSVVLRHLKILKTGKLYSEKQLRKELKVEIEAGNLFYQSIIDNEKKWIAENKNPEEEFKKEYYNKKSEILTDTLDKGNNVNKNNKSDHLDVISASSNEKDNTTFLYLFFILISTLMLFLFFRRRFNK